MASRLPCCSVALCVVVCGCSSCVSLCPCHPSAAQRREATHVISYVKIHGHHLLGVRSVANNYLAFTGDTTLPVPKVSRAFWKLLEALDCADALGWGRVSRKAAGATFLQDQWAAIQRRNIDVFRVASAAGESEEKKQEEGISVKGESIAFVGPMFVDEDVVGIDVGASPGGWSSCLALR